MNSKVTELVRKINFLTGQYDFPNLSKLEFDLLMQHLRELYQELDVLRNGTKMSYNTSDNTTNIQKPAETTQIEKPQQDLSKSELSENDKQSSAEIPSMKVISNSETIRKPENSGSHINEKIKPEASLNDKLKTDAIDVNRKLAAGSLKDLLDLNKKFAVLTELFKGDGTAFNQSISDIDNIESWELAEAYIHKNLVSRFGWDLKSQTCKMFMKLVAQKFE